MVKECLLKLLIKVCLKNILRYGKKISDLVGNELYEIIYFEDDEKDIRYINSRISIINGEIKANFCNNSDTNLNLEQKVTYDYFSLIELNSINESINDDNDCVRYLKYTLKYIWKIVKIK